MKIQLTVLSALAALAVAAQPAHNPQRVESKTSPVARKSIAAKQAEKPGKTKVGKFTASGAVVKAVTSDKPLQLINPWAPMRYGSAEENVARDPITGEARGVKVVSLTW